MIRGTHAHSTLGRHIQRGLSFALGAAVTLSSLAHTQAHAQSADAPRAEAEAAPVAPDGTQDIYAMETGDVFIPRPAMVGLAESQAETVSHAAAVAVRSQGLLPFTAADARTMLDQKAMAQLLASSDVLTLSALAEKVDAPYLLALTVSAVDGDTVVQARLIRTAGAAVLSRRELRASAYDGAILNTIKAAARLALSPVFEANKGEVFLTSTEEGADVLVDDAVVGSTPLATPLIVPGGSHVIRVHKDGFVAYVHEVHVTKDAAIELHAALRPSAQYMADYRDGQTRLHAVAWTTTALTAALAVTGGVGTALWLPESGLIGTSTAAGLRAEYEALDGTAQAAQRESYDARIKTAQNQAQMAGLVSAVGVIGTVVGLGIAVPLWLNTDDPNKYAQYE